jgi:hypothetical protein
MSHFVIALGEVLGWRQHGRAAEKAGKRIAHVRAVLAGFALGCAVGTTA